MQSTSLHVIKLDSPIDPLYLSPHTFLTPFGLYHMPHWEKASIKAALMSSYSVNMSAESPNSIPSLPAGASVADVSLLSPCTILAALDGHLDIPATQLCQLIHGLALTIQTCASQHAAQVAGLKSTIAKLEDRVSTFIEHATDPPKGYQYNDGLIPDFDILQDGNTVHACYIHLHDRDPTKVWGLMGSEKPGKGPYSKSVYATPVAGLVPVTLPSWFHAMLIRRTTRFKKLRNAAIKANNLGIVADISHYHQDHNALCQLIQEQDMLSAKLDLVQERLGLTHGWLESANAPNIIGHLEWEEEWRIKQLLPFTPKQRQGHFA